MGHFFCKIFTQTLWRSSKKAYRSTFDQWCRKKIKILEKKCAYILHRITHNLHTRPVYRTLVGAAQCGTKMGIIQTIFDEFPQNFICESTEYPGGQTNELRQFMVTTGVTNRCQTNASCTQVHQRPVYRTGHKILLEHRYVPFIIFLVFLGT